LAGSEKAGPDAARDDLFQDRVVVITPLEQTPADCVESITGFWSSLGASVVRMAPAAHDQAVAATSHLPHVVASALAAAPERCCHWPVAAGATTRVAGGSAVMAGDLTRQSPTSPPSLDSFRDTLDQFRPIDQGDSRLSRTLQAEKPT
jgi:prephenate dehydrogenase